MDYQLSRLTKFDWITILIFIPFVLNGDEILSSLSSFLLNEDIIPKSTLVIATLTLFATLVTWSYDKHRAFILNRRFRDKVFMYDLRCNLDYTNEHINYINYNLGMGKLSVRLSYLDDRLINSLINSHKIIDLPEDVIQRIFAVGNKMAGINKLLDSFFSPNNRVITNESLAVVLDQLHQLREHLRNIFIDLGKEKEYLEKTKSSEEKWKNIQESLNANK